MSKLSRSLRSLLIATLGLIGVATLSGCQTTLTQYRDCKSGDWVAIGKKDGAQGLEPKFDERKKFCSYVDSDKIKDSSASAYQIGWQQGNGDFWYQLGLFDGAAPQALSYFDVQVASKAVQENKTPLNKTTYQQGWTEGNRVFWYKTGNADGAEGLPASEEKRHTNIAERIGANWASYQHGWGDGNLSYWSNTGRDDAANGIPDSELKNHIARAQSIGLLVRAEAYQNAWNAEIIEYWKRLAWTDAMNGQDVNTRRIDAKNRGLKFTEAEYKQRWEERVIQYWTDVGKQDGFGKFNQLEARMANARRDNVFIIRQTRDVYNQAWSKENQRYCSPDNAFDFGRRSVQLAFDVCAPERQNQVRRAWHNGREFEFVSVKHAQTINELNALQNRRADLERQLDRMGQAIVLVDTPNGVNNNSNANTALNNANRERERYNEQTRRELRSQILLISRQIEELRRWEFTYDSQLRQLKQGIYEN
jgi:hypothetical protein